MGTILVLLLAALTPEQEIRGLLERQAADWNRGDVSAFMKAYEDSVQTAYVGRTVVQGYQRILKSYQERYPTRERMGTLEFSDIEIRMLGSEHAVVIGRFQLERPAAPGGKASGIFTLVLSKTPGGWKIVLDHTS